MNGRAKNRAEQEIEKEVYGGILPVRGDERTSGFIDALLILSGYCIATWSYTQGAYLTGLVGFKQLLITSFAGALLMLMIYQLPVILSARFGIDIWIWLRAVFGVKGVRIVSVIIIIVNFPWYAVCCEMFASSMTNLAAAFGITLPGWTFLGLKLFCVGLGTILAWQGVKTITRTTRILVPLLLAVGALVIFIAFKAVPFSDIWNYQPEITMPHSTAYILAVEANFAFVITLVGGMAGVPRVCKSEKGAFYAGVFGQGLSGSFFVVVGAVMVIAMQCATGKVTEDPTEMLVSLASPVLALASLLLVAFANVGTQAVGSYLYGVTLKSTFSKLSYHVLILILGGYVALLCIWGKIIDYFGSFLTISACIYAPLAALLFVDFFFIRKQKLDFRSAYEIKGHDNYRYTKGYNLIGLILLAIGCMISLLIYNPVTGEIHNKVLFLLTPTGAALRGTGILYWRLYLIPGVRRYVRKDVSINPDTTAFDREKTPPRQSLILFPLILGFCKIITSKAKLKIEKHDMEGFKPPYLVLGTHQSFTDFYVTPIALAPHRANYISELEGFEYFGEWIYRRIGCLGTRKFIYDLALIRNIKKVLDRGDNLVIYPEARYANVGTSSELSMAVAKMVKMYKYPVVVLNMQGNYLQSPIWNLTKRKEVRLHTDMYGALKKEDIEKLSVKEIHDKLEKLLEYDEYAYQRKENIRITYKDRAKGLHKPLYQCPCCGDENHMNSDGAELFCEKCGARWFKDELSDLHLIKGNLKFAKTESLSGSDLERNPAAHNEAMENKLKVYTDEEGRASLHIPDWYEWERKNVIKEIADGKYSFKMKVQIDALPNAKNFIDCGTGELIHEKEGFTLKFMDYRLGKWSEQFFLGKSMSSIHTEYDYRGKGECITLSNLDDTYFLFPVYEEGEEKIFHATKLQFAAEHFYKEGIKK